MDTCRFGRHAVEVEQNRVVIARGECDNRSYAGHDLFLPGKALVSCGMESACRCDIRKALSVVVLSPLTETSILNAPCSIDTTNPRTFTRHK